MTAIQIRGLRKSYNEVAAVGGVDLDVRQGEVFALLGPNGAGKTTTVEILEGHRHRDAGDVSVLGEDPGTAGRAWRARIGIVLQTANDAAELTVRESVRHYAGYYPSPAPVDEVIEQVGLTEKAGTRVKALSGGQRRRLDVALGVIGRPELVFLDEPTTGFDPEARRQFWDLVRSLAAGGTTILLTTHYLDEAEALADRVAVIAGGRIVAEGTPATLGGRSTAKATVSWLDESGPRSVLTDTPTALIAELSQGRELAELTVTRPSLEDTYLELIGRPRDLA
ncbi:ABC transporter ATP-binding protein [Actinophytocola oryzae]|uniref:ABC-2 type transport system ATP-binding protein n=1 Tax=Actinophytocola oryzae TaxID=502181 RepID=A0A4R7UY30_9PSEU|nr:ABC transporter ATP-binding protein [Actinophytocola oryzae]TDV41803.1 ABC-2 type transport system ATP-binding protein [Actinophytocola oryzae]